MEKIFYLAYIIIILMDIVIICDARRLLLDFLIGQRNRKNAEKIHAEQNFLDRVSMGYIQPMLKKYGSAFRKYRVLYLVYLCSMLPQYVIIILCHIFLHDIIWYIFGAFGVIKILLAAFYRLQSGANRMSVYAQKK